MNYLYRPLLSIVLALLFVHAVAANGYAVKRVGVIMTGDIPYYQAIHETFAAELNRRFAGEDKIEIILQRPFPNPISWSNAARKLIAFDVDLIVTYGSPATQAVIHEKSSIPLIYVGLYDPDQAALAGQNAAGCGFKVPLSSIVRYFKGLKAVNSLGIICSGVEEDSVRQYETMKTVAEQLSIKTLKMDVRSRADLDNLKLKNQDAVFITGSALTHLWLDDILAILKKEQVPTADIFPDDLAAGVLMTLFQPSPAQGQMAAEMAARILRGEKPESLVSHVFRDTELVFNLLEARQLGITFPIHLLIEATRVIQ